MTVVFAPARTQSHPPAPDGRRDVFSADAFGQVARFYDARPELAPTPLVELPALAAGLGLRTVWAKDETHRFGLQAFKLLGARFAIETLLAEGTIAPGQMLVCASEGNHGRAVAHTARQVGCTSRIYLSTSVAEARATAIAQEGAEVVRVPGTYDDAVRQATADAARHGWLVVSDTAWPGYERIPQLIMLGYTRLMDEVARAFPPGEQPTAVFVPTGVGGLLAAVATWCHWRWGPRVHVVSVEPTMAACMLTSARAGQPTVVAGPLTTMMGPLRCGEVSTAAFEAASPCVAGYVAIDDEDAAQAMRLLARPTPPDPAIAAGASGAAALGGLLATMRDPAARELRDTVELGPDAGVLLIVSEGVTDPDLWHAVLGDA